MRLVNYLYSVAICACLLSTTAFAGDSFFQVGKQYIFIPRSDVVMKGTVVQVTDQEVVFTDRYELKNADTETMKGDPLKTIQQRSKTIAVFLKSKNKQSLLNPSFIKDIPVSYSRANMTALEIPN